MRGRRGRLFDLPLLPTRYRVVVVAITAVAVVVEMVAAVVEVSTSKPGRDIAGILSLGGITQCGTEGGSSTSRPRPWQDTKGQDASLE